MKSLTKGQKSFKKTNKQTETLKLKNTMNEKENALESITLRMNQAEERIFELEERN